MPGIPALEGWRREDPLGSLASSLAALQVRAPGSERNRNSMEYAYNKREKAQGPLLASVLAPAYVSTRTHMHAHTHTHTYSHTNKK